MKLTWGSQDIAGTFTSFEKEKRQKAAKAPGSKGPRSRGGKRVPTDVSEERIFRAAVAKQPNTRTPAENAGNSSAKPVKKAAKAKLITAAAPKVERMAKPKLTVQDIKQTIAPMEKMSAKRDVRIGGLLGRTGGKWHLGKRPGKG